MLPLLIVVLLGSIVCRRCEGVTRLGNLVTTLGVFRRFEIGVRLWLRYVQGIRFSRRLSEAWIREN